jgi:hypothetical protein
MLIGCGGFLAIFLMLVGGVFYEELMMHLGATVARIVIIVLAALVIGVVGKIVTMRAPET